MIPNSSKPAGKIKIAKLDNVSPFTKVIDRQNEADKAEMAHP